VKYLSPIKELETILSGKDCLDKEISISSKKILSPNEVLFERLTTGIIGKQKP
jgi:hypothetical protein